MAFFARLSPIGSNFFRMFYSRSYLAIGYARLAACLLPLLAGTPIYLQAGDYFQFHYLPPVRRENASGGTTPQTVAYFAQASSAKGWCFFNAAPKASRSSVR